MLGAPSLSSEIEGHLPIIFFTRKRPPSTAAAPMPSLALSARASASLLTIRFPVSAFHLSHRLAVEFNPQRKSTNLVTFRNEGLSRIILQKTDKCGLTPSSKNSPSIPSCHSRCKYKPRVMSATLKRSFGVRKWHQIAIDDNTWVRGPRQARIPLFHLVQVHPPLLVKAGGRTGAPAYQLDCKCSSQTFSRNRSS